MDLRSLRYFVGVADAGNVSRAAVNLHRSQPALSRSIQELEGELGLQLFLREGRRVTLSSEGRSLLEFARRLLEDADGLAEHARMLRSGKTLILRIGGAANTVERAMPGLMQRFRKKWPSVETFFRPDGGTALLGALERGEIDIAITRHTDSDLLESRIAFPTHLIAVLNREHERASQASIAVADLHGERLLVPPPTFTSRMLIDAACNAERVRPRIVLETHELNALIALAEAAQGIAVVPSTVAIDGRTVKALPIRGDNGLLGSWTAVVWARRYHHGEHVKAFAEEAVDLLRTDYPGKHLKLPALAPL